MKKTVTNKFIYCWIGFITLFPNILTATPTNSSDSLALVALYQATNGSSWATPWVLTDSVPAWFGVGVDTVTGRVESLNLVHNQLFGMLPIEIGDLTALVELRLDSNQLIGTLPDELGMMQELEFLSLSFNQFSGAIPSSLDNLDSLSQLFVYNNDFSAIDLSLGVTSPISIFWVHNNQLTFEDILPILSNGSQLTDFSYHSQDSLGNVLNLSPNTREELSLQINEDDTVNSNQYEWFKDGISLQNLTGQDTFMINSLDLSHSGVYTCVVTNTLLN